MWQFRELRTQVWTAAAAARGVSGDVRASGMGGRKRGAARMKIAAMTRRIPRQKVSEMEKSKSSHEPSAPMMSAKP